MARRKTHRPRSAQGLLASEGRPPPPPPGDAKRQTERTAPERARISPRVGAPSGFLKENSRLRAVRGPLLLALWRRLCARNFHTWRLHQSTCSAPRGCYAPAVSSFIMNLPGFNACVARLRDRSFLRVKEVVTERTIPRSKGQAVKHGSRSGPTTSHPECKMSLASTMRCTRQSDGIGCRHSQSVTTPGTGRTTSPRRRRAAMRHACMRR